MHEFLRFVLTWAGIILVFDVCASYLSLLTGVPYPWFTVGSIALYVTVGYRGALRFGLRRGIIGTILVATVDATLGWWLSWLIGPGQVGTENESLTLLLTTGAIGALVFGGITGWIGGAIALKRQRATGIAV